MVFFLAALEDWQAVGIGLLLIVAMVGGGLLFLHFNKGNK